MSPRRSALRLVGASTAPVSAAPVLAAPVLAAPVLAVVFMAVLLSTVTGSLACRRGRSTGAEGSSVRRAPLALGSIEVVAAPEGDGRVALDTEALARVIAARLRASGLVLASAIPDAALVPPGDGAAEVRVFARVTAEVIEVPPKAKVRASAVLQLDTRPSDVPGALAEQLAGSGEGDLLTAAAAARADRTAAAERIAERTVADLLDAYLGRARLEIASPDELHALLARDNPLREEAIRQVGTRQLRAETPRLLELLRDDNEAVRDAALGALLALREPRAVHALTQSRSMKDRREMRKILDALATLGGAEALDYLSFVAEGHSDEEIRTMAAEARDRLLRHLDAGR
jgi:hypothetical protein